jgi:hypothetical protein
MLRARMGIRAHPTLINGKAWKGQSGTQSYGCAGQSVRPSPHSISQTSVGKLLNRSIFDPFKFAWSSKVMGSHSLGAILARLPNPRGFASEGGGEGGRPFPW